jgi:TPP-dependent pyruvate/acetoin dehydrogenase alpha subunit
MNYNKNKLQLDGLDVPGLFHDPLRIDAYHNKHRFAKMLEMMLLIRSVEIRLASARKDGLIGGPVHLGVGQEAVAVGISEHLRRSDMVFGAHRSHSHLLALGGDVRKLFAEILGRDTGHSRGMGGSMHLWDESVGFYGSVPIVAGTVPLAVGAAMASRLSNRDQVAVAYFGDGACEEGVVHESLNLARIQNDPVIFVVENNLFASHMHISIRQPGNRTARFAEANGIPFCSIDGNDVALVSQSAQAFIDAARRGSGPAFIEAVTYRWYGHVDWREDIDVGVNRSQDDVSEWRSRDPIKRLATSMISEGLMTESRMAEMKLDIERSVNDSWLQALSDPFPAKEALLDRVFKQ